MKSKITDTTALASVSTADLTAWLRAAGWTLTETAPSRFYRFGKAKDGGTFEVEVPYTHTLRDFPRRIAEVLDELELAEGRSQIELLRDIREAQVDVTRLRVVSEVTRRGRIPVDKGATFFAQARDLMLAAACAALDKRAAYPNRKPAQALEYIRTLKYGPSEEGSYIATIESPVPPALQLTLDGADAEPPFSRRAMLTLADGLQATQVAVAAASATNDVQPFESAVAHGLNANLCDALAGLVEGFEAGSVEVGIGWASSRPSRLPPVRYSFPHEQASLLREAARILRTRQPQPDFELEGVILKLESLEPSVGGSISVASMVEGHIRRVKVELEGADYARAVEAHRNERAVLIEGELVQGGRSFTLRRPTNLRVLDP